MDLNQLLYHHQVALIEAREARGSGKASLVDHYARRIRDHRRDCGLLPFAGWPSEQAAAA